MNERAKEDLSQASRAVGEIPAWVRNWVIALVVFGGGTGASMIGGTAATNGVTADVKVVMGEQAAALKDAIDQRCSAARMYTDSEITALGSRVEDNREQAASAIHSLDLRLTKLSLQQDAMVDQIRTLVKVQEEMGRTSREYQGKMSKSLDALLDVVDKRLPTPQR